VYAHISTDFSTDLSWDGQSSILWQQWKREGVERVGLEGRQDSDKVSCGSTESIHTNTYYYTATTASTNVHRVMLLATTFPLPMTVISSTLNTNCMRGYITYHFQGSH